MSLSDAKLRSAAHAKKRLQEVSVVNPRRVRNRRTLSLDSIEIRSTPAHFRFAAQAAVALRPAYAAAHARHVMDSRVEYKKGLTESTFSIDSSHHGSPDPSDSGSTNDEQSSDGRAASISSRTARSQISATCSICCFGPH
jgi:hypothetical protein